MNKFDKYIFNFEKTGYFSKLAIDIVNENNAIKDFLQAFSSDENILKQIEFKQKQEIDRTLLCEVLINQYQDITLSPEVQSNIEALKNKNTFTICTAHQPCIFTGPLYFIYKIAHAIKVAQYCNQKFSQYHFVPVFYMGTEDNDLDEIGSVKIYQQAYLWKSEQQGASGRMMTDDMQTLKQQILSLLDLNCPDEKWLYDLFNNAYKQNTLSQATRVIVNALFEKYGLVVIDADEKKLKKNFTEVIKNELLHHKSFNLIQGTIKKLENSYSVQARGRQINLFYLKESLRERIEDSTTEWIVKNTNIHFDKTRLLNEINSYPENFSPNVILRPLYQEMILPNVLFLGGGGELAYWSELKPIFEFYKIPYPIIQLRNSFLIIDKKTKVKMSNAHLKIENLFEKMEDKIKQDIASSEDIKQLSTEFEKIQNAFGKIENIAKGINSSLFISTKAHHAKFQKIQKRIEEKFYAHLKRNELNKINIFNNIKSHLFPSNSLQEREENLIPIFKMYGKSIIDTLVEYQECLKSKFIVLVEKD